MRFAVLGSPVAHSKSPAMHAAAYRALGMAHTYEAIDCDEVGLARLVAELRRGEWGGFNVTVPHKVAALRLADEAADVARRAGAANTLARAADGKIVAHNTDVSALVHELARLAGEDGVRGKTAVVIGTGGASRAAISAVAALGARRVVVIGRNAAAFADEAEAIFRNAALDPAALATTAVVARALGDPPFAISDVAAIVQTTTCGMKNGPDGAIVADAIAWSALPKTAVALDAVYAPALTPFVDAARGAGLRADSGAGWLARQGAFAIEIWLGTKAPYDAMRAAIDP